MWQMKHQSCRTSSAQSGPPWSSSVRGGGRQVFCCLKPSRLLNEIHGPEPDLAVEMDYCGFEVCVENSRWLKGGLFWLQALFQDSLCSQMSRLCKVCVRARLGRWRLWVVPASRNRKHCLEESCWQGEWTQCSKSCLHWCLSGSDESTPTTVNTQFCCGCVTQSRKTCSNAVSPGPLELNTTSVCQ